MRKDVVGYENYEFDNELNIFNKKTGRKMKQWKNTAGYMVINLSKNGIVKKIQIHRLIANTFISNPNNKPFINHINGIKSDNRIENLEWVTNSENMKHAYQLGLQKPLKGDKHYNVKIKDSEIPDIVKLEKQGYKHREIAERYNCSRTNITQILRGKSRK